ncbi:MAG: Uma2 family endonuclease [Methylococcaceae bacterium]|nr:Uma2 family endonuclease [Methylococcaceae bacterium]
MSVSTEGFCKKHLTNLAEWKKLGEANIFPPDSRLELINGEIIEMAPIGSHHASHLKRLNKLFSGLIHKSVIIAVQDPLQLSDLSEPGPDFMLLRSSSDFYYEQHPNASDVFLLIEIADNSLKFDQNQKLRLYALHNIPEYWLLNVNDACLEVYRQPHDGLYAEKTTLRSGDKITLSQLNTISINLAEIL